MSETLRGTRRQRDDNAAVNLARYEAPPAGDSAVSGGLLSDRLTGVDGAVPVNVWVPGSPPSPFQILNALLIATGSLR
jgi:hypothetical protein